MSNFSIFTCERIFEPPLPHANVVTSDKRDKVASLSTAVSFPGMKPPEVARGRNLGPSIVALFMSIGRKLFEGRVKTQDPNEMLDLLSQAASDAVGIFPDEGKYICEWLKAEKQSNCALMQSTSSDMWLSELILALITFVDKNPL